MVGRLVYLSERDHLRFVVVLGSVLPLSPALHVPTQARSRVLHTLNPALLPLSFPALRRLLPRVLLLLPLHPSLVLALADLERL